MIFKTWPRTRRSFRATCRYVSTLATRASRPQIRGSARGLQFKHLTTLFYSSVIATAAAADIKVKRKRRKQWEILIAKAEQDLRGDGADSISHEISASSSPALESESESLLPEHELEERPLFLNPLSAKRIRASVGSISATQEETYSRERQWSPEKLLSAEYSVAKLALRLIHNLPEAFSSAEGRTRHSDSYLKDVIPELHTMSRAQIELQIQDLNKALHKWDRRKVDDNGRMERPPLPRFMTDNWGNSSYNESLNKSLVRLFQGHSGGRVCLTSTLQQVSQALLTSSMPVDVSCYNILINRLSKLRLYGLADMVIESLWETQIPPNEVSVDTILNHYIEKNDFPSFHSLVSQIQVQKDGLTLADPQSTNENVGASELNISSERAVQIPRLDSRIYESIIKGYLRFNRASTAKKWHSRMLKDGHKTGIHLQLYFLSYSTHSQNWDAGYIAWTKLKARFPTKRPGKGSSVTKWEWEKEAYYLALRLCRVCQQPQEFRQIYEEGLARGISLMSLLSRDKLLNQGLSWSESKQLGQKKVERLRLGHRLWQMRSDLDSWRTEVLLLSKQQQPLFSEAPFSSLPLTKTVDTQVSAWKTPISDNKPFGKYHHHHQHQQHQHQQQQHQQKINLNSLLPPPRREFDHSAQNRSNNDKNSHNYSAVFDRARIPENNVHGERMRFGVLS